jgi:hypothetical protein
MCCTEFVYLHRVSLLAALLVASSQAVAEEIRAATTDIEIVQQSGHQGCAGDATVVKNKNNDSRVFASIQVSLVPAGRVFDRFFAEKLVQQTRAWGVLLLPGEAKVLGCGKSGWTLAGAYYPSPDTRLPDDPNPADFLALSMAGTACAGGKATLYATNLHPIYGVGFQLVRSGKTQVVGLSPGGQFPIGCGGDWGNLTFERVEFSK